MSAQPVSPATITVEWVMDAEQADDLADILGQLEDFLRQASAEAIDELASYQIYRVLDPSRWADWLADYLGDQGVTLRAATRAATEATPTGDPS